MKKLFSKSYDLYQYLLSYFSKKVGLDLNYFLSGGFWLSLFQGSNMIKAFIISIIFANIMAPDAYGKYNFVMTMLVLCSAFALPSMGSSVIQSVAKKSYGTYNKSLRLSFLSSFIGLIILIGTSIYYHIQGESQLFLLFIILSFLFPIYHISSYYQYYYIGRKEFSKHSFIGSSSNLITLTIGVLTLYFTKDLLYTILALVIGKTSFELLFTIRVYLKNIKEKISYKSIKHGIKTSPIQSLTLAILRLENILIGVFIGFVELAYYAIISLLPNQFRNLLNIIAPTFLPKLSEKSSKIKRNDILRNFLKLEFIYIIIIVIYSLSSFFILDILYDPYKEYYLLSNLFAITLISSPYILIEKYFRSKLLTKKINIINSIIIISTLLIIIPSIVFFDIITLIYSKIFQSFLIILTSIVLLYSR
jgi:O-antigen/teichoic acid export membrane protein